MKKLYFERAKENRGEIPTTIDDDHFVRFVINQTLTNILLITEAKFKK